MATKKVVSIKKKVAALDLEADSNLNQPKSNKDLASVQELAEEMRGIESWLSMVQEKVKLKTDRYAIIQNTLLPDLMTSIGLANFTLVTGEIISIKDIVRASIPAQSTIDKADGPERAILEQRRADGLKWLKANKADSLIKTEVVASFGKGQSKAAEKLRKDIIKEGYLATLEQTVNFQTLNKFIRERIEAGAKVPEETFALFSGKQAVLAKAKKK